MKRSINPSLFLCIAIATAAISIPVNAQNAPRMQISSQQTFVGEAVTLNLQIENAKTKEAPNFPTVNGLKIEAAGVPQQQTMTTIVNGRRSERSTFTYRYQITPTEAGDFIVPAVTVETENGSFKTNPFSISAEPSVTGDLLFAEIQTEDTSVFVGQAMDLKLRIWLKPYHSKKYDLTVSAEDMFRLTKETTNWGPFKDSIEKISKSESALRSRKVSRESSDGEQQIYYLFEIDAQHYPTSEGKISLADVNIEFNYPTALSRSRDPFEQFFQSSPFGASQFQNNLFDSFRSSSFGNSLTISGTRPISTAPGIASVNVLPIPLKDRPMDYRGAVGNYRMVTQASPTQVKSGDPITLKIGIQGTGPMELVQAPPLNTLTSLTKDFKVFDEPLAGIVEGDVKVFTTTIRPRTAGISEIPAIPLSFFNPDTAGFFSVQSDPIPIVVEKADELALDAIVGTPGSSNKTQSRPKQKSLDLNNVREINFDSTPTQSSNFPMTWLFLIAPPVALGIFIGFIKTRSQRPLLKLRATRKKIANAKTPHEISKQILNWLEHQLDRRSDTLTRPEAITLLSSKIDDSTREELNKLLIDCENAAFNGDQSISLTTKKQNAVLTIKKIKAQLPCFSLEPGGQRIRQFASVAPLALGFFLATVLLAKLLNPAQPHQSPPNSQAAGLAENNFFTQLNSSQKVEIFQAANRDYDRGNKIKGQDTAEAAALFSEAIENYQLLVDAGVRDTDLFLNLGNAHLQNNAIGYAIANYQKSLRCSPWNHQANENMQIVMRATNPQESNANALSSTLNWISRLPPSIGISILLLSWTIICVATAIKLSAPSFRLRHLSTTAALFLLIGMGMTQCGNSLQPLKGTAVAVASEITMFQGSSENTPPVMSSAIAEGELVRVLQERGKWSKIESTSGIRGWAQSDFFEKV
ncbi:BatD family protein [Mariniblastus sp.]|nr:BatD family protein [Mariniblastus sp.]